MIFNLVTVHTQCGQVLVITACFSIFFHIRSFNVGYWHQRLMRGMATLPQGNQELLVVRDKVGRPQVSLG